MIFSFCSMRVRLVLTTKRSAVAICSRNSLLAVAGHHPGIGQFVHGLKEFPGEDHHRALPPHPLGPPGAGGFPQVGKAPRRMNQT